MKKIHWPRAIAQWEVPELCKALPKLSESTAYAWKAGDREPAEYAKPVILDFLRRHAPAQNKPPHRRAAK